MGSLEEKDGKRLKGVSKAIYILAKIAKVLSIIAIPFIVLAMIVVLVVIRKFDYQENTLFFNHEPVATLQENDNGISIIFDNNEENKVDIDAVKSFSKVLSMVSIKNYLENNSFGKITLYFELALLFAIAVVVDVMLILKHTEKLYKNIYELDTPFNEENTLHIKNIVILMLVNIGIALLASIVFSLAFEKDYDLSLSGYNLIEILVTISMYYVFKYGTNLQSKSKMVIYQENNI